MTVQGHRSPPVPPWAVGLGRARRTPRTRDCHRPARGCRSPRQ